MRLFITGATGIIGQRLVPDRLDRGDSVVVLTRDVARARRVFATITNLDRVTLIEGDPVAPGPWQEALDGCDAIINLAGAGVSDRRWSASYKRLLISSRVVSTRHVIGALQQAHRRPATLVNASAMGYYGETGSELVDESAAPPAAGSDFLADLTAAWEAEARAAEALGTRVVLLRTSLVLDDHGGALGKMLPLFRLGLGGPLGSGRQLMSWIHWRDMIGVIDLALDDASIRGALNASSPRPVTNREFTRALGRALRRPAFLPAPRFMLRAALGEIARYVTMSQGVLPAKAVRAGYRYSYPDLEPALRSLVSKG